MNITIYLDMDDVSCMWKKPVCEMFDMPKCAFGSQDVGKELGVSWETIWNKIDEIGSYFWRTLEETPWFRDLYAMCQEFGDVFFLSSSIGGPDSVKGKVAWLQDRFGAGFSNYIFTSHKYKLASKDSILIDDHDHFVRKFIYCGGHGITMPQPWNKLSDETGRRLEYTRSQLQTLSKVACGKATMSSVFDSIIRERHRQDVKWGLQEHTAGDWSLILAEEIGEASERFLNHDKAGAAKELTEAAAVIVNWLEHLYKTEDNGDKRVDNED